MSGLPFAFAFPAALAALAALPLIWWLLKLTPPSPRHEVFPPLKILAHVLRREETPAKSPWWLTLLRIALATVIIFALADPILNPRNDALSTDGPLAIVMDNGWATAEDWDRRMRTAQALVDDAESRDMPVSIVLTADRLNDATPSSAAIARDKLAAARPHPLQVDRDRAVTALEAALQGTRPGTLAFLSDGMAVGDDDKTVSRLADLSPHELRLIEGDGSAALAITGALNEADSLDVTATRLNSGGAQRINVDALDSQGRQIASGTVEFASGQSTASGKIEAPFELRNDFARLSVAGVSSAGAVHLLDDGFRRRRVALLTGDSSDDFQPLLAPLYYIQRALQPYADLIQPGVPDLAVSIPEVLQQNPSAIVMADIGRLPENVYEPMQKWLQNGGTLIRFAGPRLAAAPSDDPLVPVILRQGERELGGALSWAEPQPLADFPAFGPFAGMDQPEGVLVRRQVLAEPTPDLAERTWASLADGTPLVTTRETGRGRIVLFHVTAEATWSNLPISGEFVEMLRRIVQLSNATASVSDNGARAESLPPYRLLDERGALTAETASARPIETGTNRPPAATIDNPPGLYGSEDGFVALNLLAPATVLRPLDTAASMPLTNAPLIGAVTTPLKPYLFMLALLLLLADGIIVLFMGGAFSRRARSSAATAAMIGLAVVLAMRPDVGLADDSRPGDQQFIEHLDNTRLAYVITGEDDVDRLSERGLIGLTDFLTYRTTLEPSAPVALDISRDELAFYPIIFWPISATAPMPTAAAISRIDAYMRSGGTVFFDTRDQFSSLNGGGGSSANGDRLRAILANMDIPPLEPVPSDHVLTRSFYLLNNFPGRYNDGPLWVEARQEARNSNAALSSSGDGVTPIMITGNDMMGAWAVDDQGAPLLPTVPASERQRELSYRSGVNIMMYMLTGNYKADQVHIPALLERLGQ